MRFLLMLFLCLPLFALPVNCEAAFKSAATAQDEPEMPEADQPDDIVLPLPYSGNLIFRPVFVSTNALIRDKSFPMGINNLQDQERQIFERQFTGHISAPFTSEDLPASWKFAKNKQGSWYFIGKYEVTRSQWQQVMKGLLANGELNPDYPKDKIQDGNYPVANVSWPEVQEFIQKYNNWLIKNHADKLPKFKDTRNVGFIRLPTEAEWEYAARGGDKVPGEWLMEEDFHPLSDNKGYADYAVYSNPRILDGPLGVGSRSPNPLGIYDTAGNVREMVNGFFHMSIADMVDNKVIRRLHGGAGGLIAKGGSFNSTEEGILPGAREEVPIYSLDGAVGARDLGFRLVLAGVNLQGGDRLTELKKENGVLPAAEDGHQARELAENMSAREMVNTLMADASGQLKTDLGKLSAKLDDQAVAEKSRELKVLENTFRSLLYQSETLRALSYRWLRAKEEYDKIKKLGEKQLTPEVRKKWQETLNTAQRDAADLYQSLEMGANYYKNILGTISGQSPEELARLGQQSLNEYGGEGIFNAHMRQNTNILLEFLKQTRQKSLGALQQRDILKGILPESQFKLLPMRGKSGK